MTLKFMTEIYIYNFHEHNTTTQKKVHSLLCKKKETGNMFQNIMYKLWQINQIELWKNSQICVSTYRIYILYNATCLSVVQ